MIIYVLLQVIMLIQVHYKPEQIQNNIQILADVDKYLYDLLIINSIADSIIYTVRIHEVKVGLYRLFKCGGTRYQDRSFHRSFSSSVISHRFKRSTRSCSGIPVEMETLA